MWSAGKNFQPYRQGLCYGISVQCLYVGSKIPEDSVAVDSQAGSTDKRVHVREICIPSTSAQIEHVHAVCIHHHVYVFFRHRDCEQSGRGDNQ